MVLISRQCPVCGLRRIIPYFRLRANGLEALKCITCGHVFISNSPVDKDNAAEHYSMDAFNGKRTLQNDHWYVNYYRDCLEDYRQYKDSSSVLRRFFEKLMYLDSVFPRKGRLLDIGCATGVFLDMARLDGWDVEGVEVSPELAAYAREKFSLNVHLLDLSKQPLGLGPFKVITMFDVIEHLPDARGMITACQKLLAPGGLLLIRTPTEEGLMRDVAKMVYWCSLKRVELPMLWFYSFEHIQSFSLKSMRRLLEERRFSILKIFREDESVERLNIPLYVKYAVKGVNLCSSAVGKQHKVCVIAKSG